VTLLRADIATELLYLALNQLWNKISGDVAYVARRYERVVTKYRKAAAFIKIYHRYLILVYITYSDKAYMYNIKNVGSNKKFTQSKGMSVVNSR
jgi:hypothetical protein